MSKKPDIRILKPQDRASEIREEVARYGVKARPQPAAVLRPFAAEDAERVRQLEADQTLAEMKSLADEIGQAWKSPRSGVELIDEQRR